MVRNFLNEYDSPTTVEGSAAANRFKSAASIKSAQYPRLYKVPVDQRRANPDAYTPFLFSFGPYHSAHFNGPLDADYNGPLDLSQALLDGGHLKRMTAAGLLSPNADAQLTTLIHTIEQQHEAQIRVQYVQWFGIETFNFRRLAGILALDAITIVAATFSQRLQRQHTPLIYPLARLVLSDAMLLENQVPVILLECALETVAQIRNASSSAPSTQLVQDKSAQASDHPQLPSLEDVIRWYCKRSSPFPEWTLQRLPPLQDKAKGEPLLAFLYDYVSDRLKPPAPTQPNQGNLTKGLYTDADPDVDPSLPTASHLAACGVRFRPCDTGDIRFDSKYDVLLLPRITVSDTTVRVLHNLLAYEATLRHPNQYTIISYVHFIDCLIDDVDDVDILTESGIICNKLGSHEELATMWNKICINVSCRNTDSNRTVMAQLDKLSKMKWRQWRASFVDIYWEKQPWLLLSIFAAIVLFVLSLLQTMYTIMAY